MSVQKKNRWYLYTPQLDRENWQQQEIRNLLDSVFGGKSAVLITYLIQHEKLSAKEVSELRKLIDAN